MRTNNPTAGIHKTVSLLAATATRIDILDSTGTNTFGAVNLRPAGAGTEDVLRNKQETIVQVITAAQTVYFWHDANVSATVYQRALTPSSSLFDKTFVFDGNIPIYAYCANACTLDVTEYTYD